MRPAYLPILISVFPVQLVHTNQDFCKLTSKESQHVSIPVQRVILHQAVIKESAWLAMHHALLVELEVLSMIQLHVWHVLQIILFFGNKMENATLQVKDVLRGHSFKLSINVDLAFHLVLHAHQQMYARCAILVIRNFYLTRINALLNAHLFLHKSAQLKMVLIVKPANTHAKRASLAFLTTVWPA